ncbi:hypothetical protein F2Q69_00011943 [Brassica cretica]|uniref:Uncharacterized protein n=1 Tax=Brassica cretica TaxID=69181 RepID=A0A8S9QIC9_BRACR|nr:hypothetical protein F2Q69_00011943 [Brassica cretica]
MLETNSSVRGSGGSFRGKSQASSSNTTEDEDDDFDGCPPKGGRGGRSGRNGYERSVVTKVRGQGSGRGKRSRATGGSSSGKQCCNMRHYEDNTDNLRDFVYEDDEDYDYNGWHEFVGNDCERDEDDDFDGCPPKGGRGGRSGRNGYEHSVVTKVRGQGSGRGQRSRATGGSSSGKQCCNMRHYKGNTDNLRDFVCTSRIVDFSYTEDSIYAEASMLLMCALTFATGNTDVGNVVLVTPPQRNEKRSHVIEDDDEYFDPTLTDATQVHGGGATKRGILSCAHNDETPSGESDHIVLVTPQKQYNKHNRVIEADDEFVSPPFTQTT